MTSAILSLNVGSSSFKWKAFATLPLRVISSGQIERIGLSRSFIQTPSQRVFKKILNPSHALSAMLPFLGVDPKRIVGVGHRVVHGGTRWIQPTRVTAAVLRDLRRLSFLAPLHLPANLQGIEASRIRFPAAPQIAVFDTAFFQTLPEHVYLYALPRKLASRYHIRRYGFHGISHEWVAREASRQLRRPLSKLNLITCHLGNGDSMTMIRGGKAMDTTMGFTPVEGLTMGTRVGDLDPLIPLVLMREGKFSVDRVSRLLNEESGLLGISGFTSDMREILCASGIPVTGFRPKRSFSEGQRRRARLALKMFLYDIQRYLASYMGLLGRVDAIVFTGGIGERSAAIRKLILSPLVIPKTTRILDIPTDEERAIAQQVQLFL